MLHTIVFFGVGKFLSGANSFVLLIIIFYASLSPVAVIGTDEECRSHLCLFFLHMYFGDADFNLALFEANVPPTIVPHIFALFPTTWITLLTALESPQLHLHLYYKQWTFLYIFLYWTLKWQSAMILWKCKQRQLGLAWYTTFILIEYNPWICPWIHWEQWSLTVQEQYFTTSPVYQRSQCYGDYSKK